MQKLKNLQKHRLALLVGILVAIVFFYFGVNTWMESQQKKVAPPPIVRSKPPVQIKQNTQQVKPIKPQPAQRPAPQVAQKPITPPKPVQKPAQVQPKPQPKPAQKPTVAVKPTPVKQVQPKPAQKPTPMAKPAQTQPVKPKPATKPQPEKAAKPTPEQKTKEPEQVAKKTPPKAKEKAKPTPAKMKEFVVQIGAFKVKANAEKSLKLAQKKGYKAFIIQEDGLHKVRLRVKAGSLISALKKVRNSFQNAFVVLR